MQPPHYTHVLRSVTTTQPQGITVPEPRSVTVMAKLPSAHTENTACRSDSDGSQIHRFTCGSTGSFAVAPRPMMASVVYTGTLDNKFSFCTGQRQGQTASKRPTTTNHQRHWQHDATSGAGLAAFPPPQIVCKIYHARRRTSKMPMVKRGTGFRRRLTAPREQNQQLTARRQSHSAAGAGLHAKHRGQAPVHNYRSRLTLRAGSGRDCRGVGSGRGTGVASVS
jgi:hypothetical protein